MLRFYFSGAPNPTKVALFLLEEAGLVYEAIPVDTRHIYHGPDRKGEQHKPEYLAINPNPNHPAFSRDLFMQVAEHRSPRLVVHLGLEFVLVLERDGTLRCWPRADLIDQPLEVREFRPSSVAKDRWH
jgi:hypothetical protein